MKRYVLVRRRGSKRWIGAVPIESRKSLSRLLKRLKQAGYLTKVVTLNGLKRIISRTRRRASPKRRRHMRHIRHKRRKRR